MDRKTRWLCLLAGCFLFLFGVTKLYREGDWVLFIIGVLIIAFSALGIVKSRQQKE